MDGYLASQLHLIIRRFSAAQCGLWTIVRYQVYVEHVDGSVGPAMVFGKKGAWIDARGLTVSLAELPVP